MFFFSVSHKFKLRYISALRKFYSYELSEKISRKKLYYIKTYDNNELKFLQSTSMEVQLPCVTSKEVN